MKCQVIMNAMEQLAPKSLKEDWDNVGLLVGNPEAEVKRIFVCLDADEANIEQAIRKNCQMIITHHPVIFDGIKKVRTDLYTGRILKKLLVNDISVFSAHTNFDQAEGGVDDILANLIGLTKIKMWEVGGETICGRIGYLEKPMTIEEFANQVKQGLKTDYVRYTSAGERMIKKVALCSGAGACFLGKAAFSGADAYVTGDVKYHDAQHAVEYGIHIVDGGHYPTEYPAMLDLAKRLEEALKEQGEIEILIDDESRDLFNVI